MNQLIATLKLALHNWKRVWDEVKRGFSSAELLANGFPSNAESYWFVTRLVIYSFENKKEKAFLPIQADVSETGAHLKLGTSWIQN